MGKEKKAERGAVKDLLKYLYVLVRQDGLSSFLLLMIGGLGVVSCYPRLYVLKRLSMLLHM